MFRTGHKISLLLSLAVLLGCTTYYVVSISKIESSNRLQATQRSEVALKNLQTKLKELDELQRARALYQYASYEETIKPDVVISPDPARAVILHRITTKKPVVFLTIDDGEYRVQNALDYILDQRLLPALFLTDKYVGIDQAYFKTYLDAGLPIENHTLNHPNLVNMSLVDQKKEICDTSDKFAALFGRKPKLFRPPYGNFNGDTLIAVKQCGMDYLIHWSALVENGVVKYQEGASLKPGDIVLMHYRPQMVNDLKAFYEAANAQGLTPASLTDWLAQ